MTKANDQLFRWSSLFLRRTTSPTWTFHCGVIHFLLFSSVLKCSRRGWKELALSSTERGTSPFRWCCLDEQLRSSPGWAAWQETISADFLGRWKQEQGDARWLWRRLPPWTWREPNVWEVCWIPPTWAHPKFSSDPDHPLPDASHVRGMGRIEDPFSSVQ